jgi:uncharacterized cupin superfamily protein
MSDPDNSQNEAGIFEPFDGNDLPWQTFNQGARFGLSFQSLGAYGGATQIGVANEVLQPGQQANPSHYHLLEEEQVYMLEGELTVVLGDRDYLMLPGHHVCFPAGQKVGHALINRSSQPCRYLIIGNKNPNEVVVFPDTGRVDVKLMRKGYHQDAVVGYWDGIDVDSAS